ncbi:histidine triad nucleotide-binding protein [Azospirillum sp. SYSU D00513]|uniref:histidine triad nucleotide-binding protein n=1 Tax=Azospirillum sp. SYSU D00513 TaxID=2812561 RepID=UPI001A9582BB|nr:histidine triad nucleotide-binding protein [Azospirillum sp. SYSU D00513]
MARTYDQNNVFARILRGEIPCKKVLETAHSLAFNDITPQAPTHVLVVPKGAYIDMDDFTARATDAEIADFMRAVGEVARMAGVVESGYRALSNCGPAAHQEVPHLHVHVVGGRDLGRMLKTA